MKFLIDNAWVVYLSIWTTVLEVSSSQWAAIVIPMIFLVRLSLCNALEEQRRKK